MNTEFVIDINGSQTKVYMQIGFFNHQNISYPLHKHVFAEMHIFLSGTAFLCCEEKDIPLKEGDILIVPANQMHRYHSTGKDSKRISFLLNTGYGDMLRKTTIHKAMLSLLCKEIQTYVLTGKNSKLRALLSYICSDCFLEESNQPIIPITNRELIIEEFFSKRYNGTVTIDDLAKELMLSSKQTAREVKRITGNTFIDELAKRKINAAILLFQTTNLTLAQISELVGYSSYAGFYKAYRRITNRLPKPK
ncbi:MAG: helix-turn-helix transcriptional regulator [Clostridia bacterium]|nr:helix-turn-helix transcriptional regulator [Clostridia bacterium]